MKYIITNGTNLKSYDTNAINDSWDFVEQMKSNDKDLFGKVAAVYRAANLSADAVSNLPFAIMKDGEDVDASNDYKNIVGFLPNPRELIRLWRISLYMTNTAYARMVKTNIAKKRLIYIAPDTMRIVTNPSMGTIDKIVRNNAESYAYNDNNLLRMWRQDYSTELLPSKNTEFSAIANSAGLLYSADFWARNFFERGAIKPSIIAVKGMVPTDKKEELQSSWGKFIRNISSEMSKIINAEAMEIQQIGDGLGDIKDTPVYKQAIENIAMASGIPLSLLISNSANYATAQTEYMAWYRDSVTPWALWMQEQLNDQLFAPLGYYFEFRPEASEPNQQEEVERANAYKTYIDSGMLPSLAAQLVGIDLPNGYEYEDLDPEPEPEPIVEPDPEPTVEPELLMHVLPEEKPSDTMSFNAWKEFDIWKRKAIKAKKTDSELPIDFVCHYIPPIKADRIREALRDGEVELAFDLSIEPENEVLKLADAINRLVDER